VAQGAAVTICNLQMDSSGVARPGARRSGVRAALCVPVRRGEQIVGTLGIGTVRPGEYTPEETQALEDLGRLIGDQLTGPEC
jgi:GAF domain-containing protein